MKVPNEGMAVLADLDARVEAAERGRKAMAERIRPAWKRVTDEAVEQAVQAAASLGLAKEAADVFMVSAACGALLQATATDKDLRLFRPREEETRRILCFGHAARAAASAANVAASARSGGQLAAAPCWHHQARASPGGWPASGPGGRDRGALRGTCPLGRRACLFHVADAFGQAATSKMPRGRAGFRPSSRWSPGFYGRVSRRGRARRGDEGDVRRHRGGRHAW